MLIFLWLFITVIFGIAYLFQLIHMSLLGLQLIALLLLYVSFRAGKQKNYKIIVGADVVTAFMVFILFYSQQTFTYFQAGDFEKLSLVVVSFIVAQLLGLFWGHQFAKYTHQAEQQKTN